MGRFFFSFDRNTGATATSGRITFLDQMLVLPPTITQVQVRGKEQKQRKESWCLCRGASESMLVAQCPWFVNLSTATPGAAVAKLYRLGGLIKQQINFVTVLEASSRQRHCLDWFLPMPLSLACKWLSFPCVFTWPCLCVSACLSPNFLSL